MKNLYTTIKMFKVLQGIGVVFLHSTYTIEEVPEKIRINIVVMISYGIYNLYIF